MRRIYKWVAEDGKEFYDQECCEKHERELHGEHEYEIELHYSGVYSTTVMAKSKEEAIQKAQTECFVDEIDWTLDETYAWRL